MAGERLICPGSIIRATLNPGSKSSLVSIRKHGDGLVVQYIVRYAEGRKEYRVGIINSRGDFAGSLLIQ